VCQDKKVVVAEAKTSCEQLLVAIVQDKRVADEQEKQVRHVSICHLIQNRRQSCALPLWFGRQALNWSSRIASMIMRHQLNASNLFPCHTCISEP